MTSSELPRRIILSRKGLDSTAGGFASPIFRETKRLLSLPIPDCGTGVRYEDLLFPDVNIGKLVNDLSGVANFSKGEVHLDPDLRENAIKRSHFRPAFGQCGNEQTHLEKKGVGLETESNDLFLFFGYFRWVHYDVSEHKWKYEKPLQELHVIHSWLQVGKIDRIVAPDSTWSEHPHGIPSFLVQTDQKRRSVGKKNNTIYTPRESLTFDSSVSGCGVFEEFSESLQLSDPEKQARSNWRLPRFFIKGLSHISQKPSPAKNELFCTVTPRGYGQEFVFEVPKDDDTRQSVLKWLQSLRFPASKATAAGAS